MILGKKYTRIKRAFNAATIEIGFAKSNGDKIKLPRKLNMLAVISLREKVSKKAVKEECEKFNKRRNAGSLQGQTMSDLEEVR